MEPQPQHVPDDVEEELKELQIVVKICECKLQLADRRLGNAINRLISLQKSLEVALQTNDLRAARAQTDAALHYLRDTQCELFLPVLDPSEVSE